MPETSNTILHTCITIALVSMLFVSLAFSAASNSVIIQSSGNIGLTSPLHVEGNSIRDINGKQVILKGVNKVEFADDPDAGWMGITISSDHNMAAELDAMKSWGVNVVRCHLAVENWKYDLQAPMAAASTKSAIKQFLTLADARGIYIVLDGYCIRNLYNGQAQDPLPYPPYQNSTDSNLVIANEQEFVNWWADVAMELKGYDNAIFELWNEPYGDETAKISWFSVAQNCIRAIRGTGATNLIVFQWNMCCAVNLDFASTPIADFDWITEANLKDPLGNVVYSTHLYRSWNHIHRSFPGPQYNVWNMSEVDLGLRSMGYYNVSAIYPLFIGEIGANMAYTGTELAHELEFYDNALTLLDQQGIGYAGFWWRNIGIYRLLDDYCTPNQAGQILRAHLLNP